MNRNFCRPASPAACPIPAARPAVPVQAPGAATLLPVWMNTFPTAMGYVPFQKWSETFDLCKGLQMGTIFPELCKPFCGKGGAPCPVASRQMTREQLLNRINQVSFAVNEMTLFLDSHPDNEEALAYMEEKSALRRESLEEYARRFGPLTIDTAKRHLFPLL